MSNGEQAESNEAIHSLKAEIATLRTQQIAAENGAGIMGLTSEDSEQYKERALRLRILVRKLAILSGG
jgi:hypothetical protein